MMEMVFEAQPYALNKLGGPSLRDYFHLFKHSIHSVDLPLETQIRVSTLLVPHKTVPTHWFQEMIESTESFLSIDQKLIDKFLDAILGRLTQHRVTYDHLEQSFSMMHSKF